MHAQFSFHSSWLAFGKVSTGCDFPSIILQVLQNFVGFEKVIVHISTGENLTGVQQVSSQFLQLMGPIVSMEAFQ
jgi:hypothetical protein